MALLEQKKTFVGKSGPFDRQRELMSLQDFLMPPLKPQLGAQNRRASQSRPRGPQAPQFIGRFRYLMPHEPNKGPFRSTKGFSKTMGAQ